MAKPISQFADSKLLAARYTAMSLAHYTHGHTLLASPFEASVISAIQSRTWNGTPRPSDLDTIAQCAFMTVEELAHTLDHLERRGLLTRTDLDGGKVKLDIRRYWTKLHETLSADLDNANGEPETQSNEPVMKPQNRLRERIKALHDS